MLTDGTVTLSLVEIFFFFFPFSSFHFSLCTLYSQIQVQNSEQIVNQIFLTHFERVLKEMELAAFN